jgi:hypothetical protein
MTPGPGFELVQRHLLQQLQDAVSYSRVVFVNGPRQAGKTTLLQQLHSQLGGSYRSMDIDRDRAAAQADPHDYIATVDRPTFIDEVQRVGDPIVIAIKAVVDRDQRPGQFILSGSTRFVTVPTISESLAGRVAILDLWPLSVAERVGVLPDLLTQVFDDYRSLLDIDPVPISKLEYLQLACTGGFPEVVRRPSGTPRSRWFSDYLRTVTQRDVRELKQIDQIERLPRLLRYFAAITAQELNVANVAQHIGVDAATVRSDLALFETVYLVHHLPAWSRSLTAKIKKRPKIHLVDSGLAAWLRGQNPTQLAKPTSEGSGPLLETFVVNEFMKIKDLTHPDVNAYHFRDRDGREIDCILEAPDGRVVAIEVKAASTVNSDDFRHLAMAREKLDESFVAGLVFYTGPDVLPFGERLAAVPISMLWNGVAAPDS